MFPVDTANCPDILALVAHMILFLLVVPSTKAPSLQAVSKPPRTSEQARFVVGLLGGGCAAGGGRGAEPAAVLLRPLGTAGGESGGRAADRREPGPVRKNNELLESLEHAEPRLGSERFPDHGIGKRSFVRKRLRAGGGEGWAVEAARAAGNRGRAAGAGGAVRCRVADTLPAGELGEQPFVRPNLPNVPR